MSDNFKAVSTDVHEFSDFIENDCYYVDKTNFIKDIMKDIKIFKSIPSIKPKERRFITNTIENY